jgi:hypothetical protein
MGTHKEIATVYEPFILLPLLYALKDKGVYSVYNHEHTAWAIQDFCRNLPSGMDDYYGEIRRLVLNFYKKASGSGVKYFLDKTPNYTWIVEDIIKIFPDAKFIFLWRNPLSVISSILKSWNDGYWNLYQHYAYLFAGLVNLASAYQKYADISVSVRYEDMVSNPRTEWERIFSYLGIMFNPDQLVKFVDYKSNARLAGESDWYMYNEISLEPLAKYKKVLSNPFRKAWCRHYLHWVGENRLTLMGYKLQDLLCDLDQLSTDLNYFGSDCWRVPFGLLYRLIEGRIIKNKILDLVSGRRIYVHK